MSALQRYRRHAQLYGCDYLFEAATEDGFEPLELGQLALALRTVDPKWRLSREQAMDLAVSLASDGRSDKDIRKMCGISQPQAREARSRATKSESFGHSGPAPQMPEIDTRRPLERLTAAR